jgi:threonylcarbamoyladenosine tRNA methylthiotransferase MtaB
MQRRYKREVFAERILKIRKMIPLAGIGADIIVGFPGETDEDFHDTKKFLESTEVSYLHVFSFSPRQNTQAAIMENMVSGELKSRRSKILRRVSEKKRIYFNRKCIGMSFNVLWESADGQGYITGLTENYIRVKAQLDASCKGNISAVKLLQMDENGNFIIEPSS